MRALFALTWVLSPAVTEIAQDRAMPDLLDTVPENVAEKEIPRARQQITGEGRPVRHDSDLGDPCIASSRSLPGILIKPGRRHKTRLQFVPQLLLQRFVKSIIFGKRKGLRGTPADHILMQEKISSDAQIRKISCEPEYLLPVLAHEHALDDRIPAA